LFEIGRVFAGSNAGALPDETECLGLIASGAATEENRASTARELDFYDLKGVLEAAIASMNLPPLVYRAAEVKHLRTGQAAKISLANGTTVGSIGVLSEAIEGDYKLRQRVYVAEIALTPLFEVESQQIKYHSLPRYPSVVRDVSLLVDRDVSFDAVVKEIEIASPADYRGVQLVGTYEGENIPADKRSVTLRIEYRSETGTLRDEEVEARHRELIDRLLKKFAATLH
jgi:phenylalanyl-tRNA synthetase beta chain